MTDLTPRPAAPAGNDDPRPVVAHAPPNLETAAAALAAPITPTALGFTRTNFAVPHLDPAEHRVVVGGAVRAGATFGMRDLAARPPHGVVTTIECAGNDRVGMRPLPPGEPWQGAAVSTSRWTGVPLRDVLRECGVAPDATHVLVTGADGGHRADADGFVPFARALPLEVALAPDTLLALEMNDRPLLPAHGAPVRLVVPGWYGMASVKWVARIELLTREFDGYFQRQRYVYDADGVTEPVTRMRVKSCIVAPAEGARVAAGPATVWGWAWSGDGAIAHVEVSTGGDGPWHAARLDAPVSAHAWTRWEATLLLDRPGRVVLRSRARDRSGAVQPDEPRANRLGYGNNAVRPVVVDVVPSGRTS